MKNKRTGAVQGAKKKNDTENAVEVGRKQEEKEKCLHARDAQQLGVQYMAKKQLLCGWQLLWGQGVSLPMWLSGLS